MRPAFQGKDPKWGKLVARFLAALQLGVNLLPAGFRSAGAAFLLIASLCPHIILRNGYRKLGTSMLWSIIKPLNIMLSKATSSLGECSK